MKRCVSSLFFAEMMYRRFVADFNHLDDDIIEFVFKEKKKIFSWFFLLLMTFCVKSRNFRISFREKLKYNEKY